MSRKSVDTNPLDLPSKDDLIDTLTAHICTKKCMGLDGNAGGCCSMGKRDYIIGPIPDAAAVLARLSKRYKRDVAFDEVFIGFEEGRKLFPDLECWQSESSFPAIRVNMKEPSLPCRFLDDDNLCSIHDIRSTTCREYYCDHINNLKQQL